MWACNRFLSVGLCAWAWCTKRKDGLDWPITLFQASVMPNTIIVGIPVLSPLYSITGSGIAAIFIGQVLWLYPILLLYEIRAAKQLGAAPAPVPQDVVTAAAAAANGIPGTHFTCPPHSDRNSSYTPQTDAQFIQIHSAPFTRFPCYIQLLLDSCKVVHEGSFVWL